MSGKGTSLWRVAGVSYLQYVNKSAAVLREALKEPVKTKFAARSEVQFAGFKWADGERGKRAEITSVKKAAEVFQKA
ncbi:Atpase, partial [Globisporangium splendens]